MKEANKDQAEFLREQMEAINSHQQDNQQTESIIDDHYEEIDVLNLPPRRQVHDDQKAKIKWRVSLALIRLIVILLFVVMILTLSYKYWGESFLVDQLERHLIKHVFIFNP